MNNNDINLQLEESRELLLEVKEMLKTVIDEQARLLKEVTELKDEQKKLHEEIKLNNVVMNFASIRNEILN